MKVPTELVEQWLGEDTTGTTAWDHLAQRAAEWALSQPVSMEPVGEVVEDDFSRQLKGIGQWHLLPNGAKLYTATQLAAARQQGADEERSKTLDAQDTIELLEMRIDQLEKSNAVLLEALEELDAMPDHTSSWLKARAAIAEVKP